MFYSDIHIGLGGWCTPGVNGSGRLVSFYLMSDQFYYHKETLKMVAHTLLMDN